MKFIDYLNEDLSLLAILGGQEGKRRLDKFTCYTLILFCLIPLYLSLKLPNIYDFTESQDEWLKVRILISLATGGLVTFFSILGYFVLIRLPKIQAAYVFTLLPISLIGLVAQTVMYKEFGMEINYRILDTIREDFATLWSIANRDYYINWILVLVLIFSAFITKFISSKKINIIHLGKKVMVTLPILFIGVSVVAFALRFEPKNVGHYNARKTAENPIFQIGALIIEVFSSPETGYETILRRDAKFTDSVRAVINERLDTEAKQFTQRITNRPKWLKKKPSHVFTFLMENTGSQLMEIPECSMLAPNLNTYAKEGIYVENFISANSSTIEAVHSMCAGTAPINRYPVNDYPHPLVVKKYQLDTLPKLAKQSGYTPLFLAASFRKFRAKGDVAEAYGYQQFIGCPDVTNHFKSNDWGVNDSDFFQWSKTLTGDLKKPHFITFLNLSNHDPFDAPVDDINLQNISTSSATEYFYGITEKVKLNYAKHTFYADLQLGNMVSYLKEKYPDALFMFVGDHGSRVMKQGSSKVPFILWNDRVINTNMDTSHWYGSHMDILATFADTLLPDSTEYKTLGYPLWSRSPTRVSIGSGRVLCSKGIFKFGRNNLDQTFPVNQQESIQFNEDWGIPRLRLKASAVEALSWGLLHSVPIPDE